MSVPAGSGRTLTLRAQDARPASADPVPAPAAGVPRLPAGAVVAGIDPRLAPDAAQPAERYAIEGLAGLGATARVWRAHDRDLARDVAVKVLSDGSPDAIAAFIDEARTTAQLSHPNVLPVYEFGTTVAGEPWFAMKRIEGRSLGQALEAQAGGGGDEAVADVNALVSTIIAVCQALSYAHHRGVVHQDVKPDNIMLGSFGEVLLVDWGSACRAEDPAPPLFGTPLYMSPEQARCERSSPASDLFCLGATMFHALVGRPPTGAADIEALIARRGRGEVDAPTPDEARRAPAALRSIALKAMAAAPSARYASAEAMLRDLKDFQGGLSVSAHRDRWREALARWYRRNRKPVWIAAAAALLLLAAGGALWREKAMERSRWRETASHRFDAGLDPRWQILSRPQYLYHGPFAAAPADGDPQLRIADGWATLVAGERIVGLAWSEPLPGDFRVEWDYRLDGDTYNLNAFIGRDREAGFTFHIGAHGNPRAAMMTRAGRELDHRRLARPLEPGRIYRFAMEKDGRHVRLEIDGESIFDHPDCDPLADDDATRFGFDTYPVNRVSLRGVRVLVRPLPQRVSPLVVARKLYRAGNVAEALRQYDEIAAAYPATTLAADALFERGLAETRAGDRARGLARLEAFERAHPRHEMVPMAIHERLSAALAAQPRDERAVRALRHRLADWRGHPVLRTALAEIASELSRSLRLGSGSGATVEEALVDQVVAGGIELQRWCEAYGLPYHDSDFTRRAGVNLIQRGLGAEVLARYPVDERTCARALRALGRMDEALARYGDLPLERFETLMQQGAYREVLARCPSREHQAAALYELGELDAVSRLHPGTAAHAEALLSAHRFDEYEAAFDCTLPGPEHPADHMTKVYELHFAKGLWPEMAQRFTHPVSRAAALLRLGRPEEALAANPRDSLLGVEVACALLTRGDGEQAGRLLREAWAQPPDLEANRCLLTIGLLPDLMPLMERPGDPRPALRAAIARRGDAYAQRLRHIAALAAGDIDEDSFRRQPHGRGMREMLLIARALAADTRGNRAEALAAYHELTTLRRYERFLTRSAVEFLRWRIIVNGGAWPADGLP